MNWYSLNKPEAVVTPSLLVYSDRVQKNIDEMLRIAGTPERLRPHIKTYKMGEIIAMQMSCGIDKFKCATITEAQLLAKTGAPDVLLAMQPVGPDIGRYFDLAERFSAISFSCLVDNLTSLKEIANEAYRRKKAIGVFVDINNGMNRTGIAPTKEVFELYHQLSQTDFLMPRGLHVYDGHLRILDFEARKKACETALAPILELRKKLEAAGITVPSVVVGGSPTFPAHAHRHDVIFSPGTVLLWDEGYGSKFLDMQFQHAAVLMTRLISKPAPGHLCFDLGHKSMASEMPFPRLKFLNTDDFEQVSQSEEHLVVKTKNAEKYAVGAVFYAVPMHICPTVAKYPFVNVVKEGEVVGQWKVAARDHNTFL